MISAPVNPEELVTQPAMAAGGVIPDDMRYAQGGSVRAESAAYGAGKRRKKARSDPWAGMRTKTGSSVKKRTKPRKSAAKKAGKPRQYERTPERGPVPTARPERPMPTNVPTPTPAPRPDPLRAGHPPNPTVGRPEVPYQTSPNWQTGEPHIQHPPNPTVGRPAPPPQAMDNGFSTIPGVANAVPGTEVPRGGSWADQRGMSPGASPPAGPPLVRQLQAMPRPDAGTADRRPPPAAGAVAARPSTAQPLAQDDPRWARDVPQPLAEDDPRWARDVPQPLEDDDPRWARDGAMYARGGVIPDDTDGPFQRAGGRRGLRQLFSRPTTKSYAKGARR